MDIKIVVYAKGFNGSKTYSIFNGTSGEPIITNKQLEKISKDFIRMYPDFSKKIYSHFQDFSGDIPSEVSLEYLDGGAKFELIEAISLEFSKIK